MRVRHYSYEAVKGYVYWIRQYIFFHNVRHPAEMGAAEAERFLTYSAVEKNASASTQNQGLSLYCFFTRKFYSRAKVSVRPAPTGKLDCCLNEHF
jgi:hypothetical protein